MKNKNSNITLLIAKAHEYRGYLEKNSNKDLDLFLSNVGDKNYNKFAETVKKYGLGSFQGQPWCAVYIMGIFLEVFEERAKEMLNTFSAWTPTFYNNFKKQGRIRKKEETPQRGDIVFFRNKERIHHVGIVTDVTETHIYTSEGNTSESQKVIPNGGAVCNKKYRLDNPNIAGFGTPNYDINIDTLDGWQRVGNDYYFFNNRKMLKNIFLDYNGLTYYFLDNGVMAKGQHFIEDKRYFFDEANGYLVLTNDHGQRKEFTHLRVYTEKQ